MPYNDNQHEAYPYRTIGTDEAKRMIEAGARVIDVRRPDEWHRGHIPEATLVTLDGIYSFGKALKDLQLPEDEAVIFACAVGQRSASASKVAMVAGLKKVYNLANGVRNPFHKRWACERASATQVSD